MSALFFLLAMAIGIGSGIVFTAAGVPSLLAGLIGVAAFLVAHAVGNRWTEVDR